jgi:hypothetical protein
LAKIQIMSKVMDSSFFVNIFNCCSSVKKISSLSTLKVINRSIGNFINYKDILCELL